MEKSFKQSVIEGLKCYVYVLVDPRDNCIFYVGKGSGNRVYQHAQAALVDDSPVRIMLMYYISLEKFLNNPSNDVERMLAEASESPPENAET